MQSPATAHDAPLLRATLYAAVRYVLEDAARADTLAHHILASGSATGTGVALSGLRVGTAEVPLLVQDLEARSPSVASVNSFVSVMDFDSPRALGTGMRQLPECSFIPANLAQGLLNGSSSLPDAPCDLKRMVCDPREYPRHPLYTYIADGLFLWSQTGSFPNLPDPSPQIGMSEVEEAQYMRYNTPAWRKHIAKGVEEINDRMALTSVPQGCNTGMMGRLAGLLHIFMAERPRDVCGVYRAGHAVNGTGSVCDKAFGQRVMLSCMGQENNIVQVSLPSSTLTSLSETLTRIGARGLMHMCGVRTTMGSVNIVPPPFETLVREFQKPHCETSLLSVGGRALAKHSHRSADLWWGPCTGSEADKNAAANRVLHRILSDAHWLNIHQMVDGCLIEVRVRAGYGARWDAHTHAFRGLLEPEMKNGHEVKWRH